MGKTKHKGPIKLNKKPSPKLWASFAPMGLGKVKTETHSRHNESGMGEQR